MTIYRILFYAWLIVERKIFLKLFLIFGNFMRFFRSELRQWFIQQEVDLFRFRFSSESVSSVKNFLQLYGIPTELVTFLLTYPYL